MASLADHLLVVSEDETDRIQEKHILLAKCSAVRWKLNWAWWRRRKRALIH